MTAHIVRLTVDITDPEAKTLAPQCSHGHPFWEGERTNDEVTAIYTAAVHDVEVHHASSPSQSVQIDQIDAEIWQAAIELSLTSIYSFDDALRMVRLAAPTAVHAAIWDEGVDRAFKGSIMRENASDVKRANPYRVIPQGGN